MFLVLLKNGTVCDFFALKTDKNGTVYDFLIYLLSLTNKCKYHELR